MRYAIAQNEWYDSESLPDGWSADAIAISGGRYGWSDAMSPVKALSLDGDGVLKRMQERIPDPEQYAGKIVHLDFENPINPSTLDFAPDWLLQSLADAMRLRWEVAASYFPNSTILLGDYGGRSWQDRPQVNDNDRLIVMGRLRDLGAFRGLHGCLFRCYPAYSDSEPLWRRMEAVLRNNLIAAKTIFGEGAMNIPAFSWHVDGVDHKATIASDGIEEMASLGEKLCGHAAFWSPSPKQFFQPAGGGD